MWSTYLEPDGGEEALLRRECLVQKPFEVIDEQRRVVSAIATLDHRPRIEADVIRAAACNHALMSSEGAARD